MIIPAKCNFVLPNFHGNKFYDDFSRNVEKSSNPPIGWTVSQATATSFQIKNGKLLIGTCNDHDEIYQPDFFIEQTGYVEAEFANITPYIKGWVGPSLRSKGGDNAVFAVYDGNQMQLAATINGIWTPIAVGPLLASPPLSNCIIRIEALGTLFYGYINGALQCFGSLSSGLWMGGHPGVAVATGAQSGLAINDIMNWIRAGYC